LTEALTSLDPRLSLLIYTVAAIAIVAVVLVLAAILRESAGADDTYGIYESGAPAAAALTTPVPAQYFQIAAFFVIFDVEAALLFTWALAAPAAGVTGLVSAAVFIGVLLAALAYLWADGALDVGGNSRGGAA
jgi:NADH-quinone oxidoreductase subunit A